MISAQHQPHPATSEEIDLIVTALAAAVAEDPVFGWLLPNTRRREPRLARFFALELHHVLLPAGTIWTADPDAGACLELPPGCWRMPFSTQLRHAHDYVGVFGHRLGHAFAVISVMEHRHPREPHYYIPYVGIAPGWQGHGLGGGLIRQTLHHADRNGLPTYLEATNERNAALYEPSDSNTSEASRLPAAHRSGR